MAAIFLFLKVLGRGLSLPDVHCLGTGRIGAKSLTGHRGWVMIEIEEEKTVLCDQTWGREGYDEIQQTDTVICSGCTSFSHLLDLSFGKSSGQ